MFTHSQRYWIAAWVGNAAESVAAHGDELHLPADLDAALAAVIAGEQKKLGAGKE